MTESIFADLVEIAGGDVAVAAARMKEFSDFSDNQHAAALSRRMADAMTVAQRLIESNRGLLARSVGSGKSD